MTVKTNPAGSPSLNVSMAEPIKKKKSATDAVLELSLPDLSETITGPAGTKHGGVESSFAPQGIVAAPTARTANKIHSITTQSQFDHLFADAPSVTAGAPNEIKFLIDRTGDSRSQLIHAENISYAPQWTLIPDRQHFIFLLIFSGLPKSCAQFDLLEQIAEAGGFFVKNILRNETDVYHVDLN